MSSVMRYRHLSVCGRTWSGVDEVSLQRLGSQAGDDLRGYNGGGDESHRENFILKLEGLSAILY